MNIKDFDPSAAKFPLTVIYSSKDAAAKAEVEHLKSKDKSNQLIAVDASGAGYDSGRYGVTADQLKGFEKGVQARDANGRSYSGLAALAAAHAAVGMYGYFSFYRAPGFSSNSTFGPAPQGA